MIIEEIMNSYQLTREEKQMEILILGNGFDLVHGLETTYSDFLTFVERFTNLVGSDSIMQSGGLQCTEKPIYEYLDQLIFINKKLCSELKQHVQKNFWIEYFYSCKGYLKENWIDFESEISRVIRSLDDDMIAYNGNKMEITDEMLQLSNFFLRKKYEKYTLMDQSAHSCLNNNNKIITFNEIRDTLQEDLDKLIRALEIYLVDYIEKKEIKNKINEIENLKPDHILSFNYTKTYQKIYDSGYFKDDKYDYVHGKTDIAHNVKTNNMVLGIDEYLDNDKKANEVEFIYFKKYYQRILKETGSKYLDWIAEITKENSCYYEKINRLKEYKDKAKSYTKIDSAKSNLEAVLRKCPKHHVYIFGHSLDVTDKDILKAFICCDHVFTTIYYYDDATHDRQIINLVKVIGPDELIKRTGGSSKTIEFIKQQ